MGQVLHFLWIHLLGACNVKGPLSVPSGTLPCSGRSQPSHASCQLFITAYYYYCVYEMLPMCQALREGPKTYLHGIYFPGSFLSLLNKQTIKKKKRFVHLSLNFLTKPSLLSGGTHMISPTVKLRTNYGFTNCPGSTPACWVWCVNDP